MSNQTTTNYSATGSSDILFSSERLHFCIPGRARDASVFDIFNDSLTMLPWLPMLCPMTDKDFHTRRELHRTQFQQSSLFLDLVERSTGITIGTAGFRAIKKESAAAEWGIVISKEYQRQGYCTEAFASNVKFAASQLGVQTITASTLPTNTRMVAFFEQIGMQVFQEVEHYGLNWIVFGKPNNIQKFLE